MRQGHRLERSKHVGGERTEKGKKEQRKRRKEGDGNREKES